MNSVGGPYPDFLQNLNGSANHRLPQPQATQPSYNPVNLAQWAASQQSQQQGVPMLPQQLNQWNNMAMQSQYPNGMNTAVMNMPAFPIFPQQMLHDALALSAPVTGPEDERMLIDCLAEARTRKDNYKNALNSLHGKNAHSASLWKDFYLEHKDRIDGHVSHSLKQKGISDPPPPVLKVAKKPDLNSFKVESSLSPPPIAKRRGSSRPIKTSMSKSAASTSSATSAANLPSGRRSTINSITAHAPSYSSRLPAPNAEIKIPDPPSRSPTPPSRLVPHAKGYRFTSEDREFFIKFVQWRLKGDPSLTRNDLCEQLAQKVPHHSVSSWYAYWQNNHDLPDKILAAAYGEVEEDESDDSSLTSEEEIEFKHRRRQPKYKQEPSAHVEEEEEGEDDAPFTLPLFDESQMGVSGGLFTSADFNMVARYVASFDNFPAASFSEKWKPWGERYPQRSGKSWAEYYRKNERGILRLAKKIKRAGGARELSLTREPSEARRLNSISDAGGPPKAKRKYAPDEQEEEESGSRAKIGKVE
ncbi:hypothetical protein GYMLUDRAFT_235259 [Collybiopsis luxurians FD-317 M1]|nr:hypothetical protein GYMLUDRAFT_235259 [Collybiopsis luxurians FD-317 M1]